MVGYFDTSLLFNLYVPQSTVSTDVLALIDQCDTIIMTDFGYSELINAFRLCQFRGEITASECSKVEVFLKQDKADFFDYRNVHWSQVFAKFDTLSESVTPSLGVRCMDLLHISIAEVEAVDCFASADNRQINVAKSIGLSVLS